MSHGRARLGFQSGLVAGAAAGGLIVALSTQAIPNIILGMMAHCEQMMAGIAKADGEAANMCQRTMAGMGQASEHATCGSSCNS